MRSLTILMGIVIVIAVNGSGQSKGGAAAALGPSSFRYLSRLSLPASAGEARRFRRYRKKRSLTQAPGREGRMSGPAALAMYSPQMAEPIEALNRWLRRNGVLGPRLTELAILVAAREIDQRYEWGGHEPAALRAGVEPAVIDVIRYNKDYATLADKDATIVRLGRQLFRQRRVDSEIFAHTVALFGRQGTFELATLMGDYAMVGIMLQAVDQQVSPERPSNLPPLAEWARKLAGLASSPNRPRSRPNFPPTSTRIRSAAFRLSSGRISMTTGSESGMWLWAATGRSHRSDRLESRFTAPASLNRCTTLTNISASKAFWAAP